MKNSARALLREMPVEAVRFAYAAGVDVWAVYCGRKDDPFRWANIKVAGRVGAAMHILKDGLPDVFPHLRKAG